MVPAFVGGSLYHENMSSNDQPRADALLLRVPELMREQAIAEARVTAAMVRIAELREREYAAIEKRGSREMSLRSIADELAVELGMGVNAVQNRLFYARLIKAKLPLVWRAHVVGDIDSWKFRVVAAGVARLESDDSFNRADALIVEYAVGHTASEVRQWVYRLVGRLEPQSAEQREASAKERRCVTITHTNEGESEVWARMPTLDAFKIQKSLDQSLQTKAANDPRSVDQFVADQFIARLTEDADGNSLVHAEIGLTIPVTSMAGLTGEPGESLDGQFALPADVVRALASDESSVIHRVVTDPVGRVLDVTKLGRFFTGQLAFAIEVRDGVCQFPGCIRPVERCQIDHREPWPVGETAGANGWCLCVRHHQMKTEGIFVPEVDDTGPPLWRLPSGRRVRSEPTHREQLLARRDAYSRTEHRLWNLLPDAAA